MGVTKLLGWRIWLGPHLRLLLCQDFFRPDPEGFGGTAADGANGAGGSLNNPSSACLVGLRCQTAAI
jgi:hypothetical protein